MALKEFTYRGKLLAELKKMSIKEFAELLPARARRSLMRGMNEQKKLLLAKLEKKDFVKTQVRDIVIIPAMVGKRIQIHRGNGYVDITITEEMLGHFLGEFALTRKLVEHHAPGVGATRSSAALSVR